VPGATVTSTSGAPGASAQIILRGAVSIDGDNQPLFVVDGVPFDNQTLNQEALVPASNPNSVGFVNRNSDYGNRAMDLNSDDIENVTILKGPEATALYGAAGASGVIIITTKKGAKGKGSITYDNTFGFSKVYRFPEIQTTYGTGRNGINDPASSYFFGAPYAAGTTLYDNFDNFLKTGITQKHNLSIEGGSDVNTFRFSTGYSKQSGVIPTTEFDRLSFRLSGSSKITSKLNVSATASYTNSKTDKASKGAGSYFLTLLTWPKNIDVRDYTNPDGSRKIIKGGTILTENDNPFWDVNKNLANDKTNRFTLNTTLSYDVLKWLNFTGNLGTDIYTTEGLYSVNPSSRYGGATNGFLSQYTQNTSNMSGNVRGAIKKNFKKISNNLILGFNFDDNKTRIEAQRGEQFIEPDFLSINNVSPLTVAAKTTVLNYRRTRWFGSYTVGYEKLLYVTFAGSIEGDSRLTSKFYQKSPYFKYGAASFAFNFTELAMFKNVKWLNAGKLRAGYSTTGKAPYSPYIIDYGFGSVITTGGGYALGVTGGNENLRPELTKQLEFGGEFKFLKNRLGLDVSYYNLRSKDQILAVRSSYGTGYVLKYINGGLVQNQGMEIVLKGTPVQTKKLSWDVTINYAYNRGKIISMPGDVPQFYNSDTWLYGNARSVAYAGGRLGNISTDDFRRNKNGDILISTTTGFPLKEAASSFTNITGNREPKGSIGFINSINYKEFSLSFNIDIRIGGDIYNGNELYLYNLGLSKKTLNREAAVVIKGVLADGLENTATPTVNTIAIQPAYRNDYYITNYVEGEFIEKDINWVRMRDITLGYKIPTSLLKRQKVVRTASLFVSATDLFMITNYSGADPNVSGLTGGARGYGGGGFDFGALANPRTINFGLKVQF
jgi:TonB-linked SusC/RagA family outer membrane protein